MTMNEFLDLYQLPKNLKKHRYVMKLLDQPLRGDISGIQDVQSYSPEYNINFQKYKKMTVNEFLDLFPLPKQSSGRKFHFLHSFKTQIH